MRYHVPSPQQHRLWRPHGRSAAEFISKAKVLDDRILTYVVLVQAYLYELFIYPMKSYLIIFIVVLGAVVQGCQNNSTSPYPDRTSQINAFPQEAISVDELKGLIYMREEEKLARDVYTALYIKWNTTIFSNIASSEQTHTDAVLTVLNKYSITDPVGSRGAGEYADSALQVLYTQLVAQGSKSLLDAYTVGATIEDLDIFDLHKQLAKSDNQDIRFVYENLTKGSRNHLRSFYSQLLLSGGAYTAQFISQAEFDTIINSPKETGAW